MVKVTFEPVVFGDVKPASLFVKNSRSLPPLIRLFSAVM